MSDHLKSVLRCHRNAERTIRLHDAQFLRDVSTCQKSTRRKDPLVRCWCAGFTDYRHGARHRRFDAEPFGNDAHAWQAKSKSSKVHRLKWRQRLRGFTPRPMKSLGLRLKK